MSRKERRIGVVGLGLIGGSFALAVRHRFPETYIAGFDARQSEMALAKRMGAINDMAPSVEWLAGQVDLLMLAVPVQAILPVLHAIRSVNRADLLISDVGSVKGVVADAFVSVFGELPPRAVLGHPIAGSEKKWYGGGTR